MKRRRPTPAGLAKKTLGRHGEDLAAQWLVARGYRIRERNVRTRLGEIDLVAEHGRTVVIVEVKTRRSDAAGMPLEAITAAKARRLRRLAAGYMADRGLEDRLDVRIDCIGITTGPGPGEERIEHVADAV